RRVPLLLHPPRVCTSGRVRLGSRDRCGTGRRPHAITTVTLPPHTQTPGCGKPWSHPTPNHRVLTHGTYSFHLYMHYPTITGKYTPAAGRCCCCNRIVEHEHTTLKWTLADCQTVPASNL